MWSQAINQRRACGMEMFHDPTAMGIRLIRRHGRKQEISAQQLAEQSEMLSKMIIYTLSSGL